MLYVSNGTTRVIPINDLGVSIHPGETWHLVDNTLTQTSHDLASLIWTGELRAWDKQSLIWMFRDIEWKEIS
jgi:hypothetical protein